MTRNNLMIEYDIKNKSFHPIRSPIFNQDAVNAENFNYFVCLFCKRCSCDREYDKGSTSPNIFVERERRKNICNGI